MENKKETKLLNFYVFNSAYGPKEGEEEKKIFYYYPSEIEIDTKIRTVGLSEAIIKFTQTFNPDQPCETLHTQKTRQIYLEADSGFWIVMTITVPVLVKIRDGQEHLEYQNDDVHDSVYKSILKQCHSLYTFFNGPFAFKTDNPVQIKATLDQFYSTLLPTLRLSHSDLLDVFAGIQFLSLDSLTFLHAQCLIKRLEAVFPTVKYSFLLFNDQLVWSGLEPDGMQTLFTFLVTYLLPSFIEKEVQSELPSTPLTGKFVTGPLATPRDGIGGQLPQVYIKDNESLYLVVYRAMNATVCLLLDGYSAPSMEFYQRLQSFLGTPLTVLADELASSCSRVHPATPVTLSLLPSSTPEAPKYIYYNQLNRATKSTVHLDNRKCGNVAVTPDVLKLLTDIHTDRNRLRNCSEIILKTMNDCWVAGKFSNLREFYIVLNQKNANLIDINDEIRRLCDIQLKNIFFND